MKVTIKVTQDDIVKGCKHDSNKCPVARALLRELPRVSYVDVCEDEMFFTVQYNQHRTDLFRCNTPSSAKDFITKFDAGNNSTYNHKIVNKKITLNFTKSLDL